ncbi:MAG: shikimate kinase [Clostridia bacterium]|nr:shikimate kinase [Clostridia bacterium]
MNIVLCGMPCSGKSAVGRELSKKSKRIVIDTDEEIKIRYGRISDIFEKQGEERFRELESEIVAEVSKNVGVIISTGGGCVLFKRNVDALKAGGKIFFIDVPLDVLCERAEGDSVRPLLSGDPVGKMKALYAERHDVYKTAADVTILTKDKSLAKIADEILSQVK